MIRSKVEIQRGNTSVFKEKFSGEARTIHFSMRSKPSDHAKSLESWSTTRAHDLPLFRPYDLDRIPLTKTRVARWDVKTAIESQPSLVTKIVISVRAWLVIRWFAIHWINWRSLVSLRSNAPCSATCPAKKKFKRNIVPHKENDRKQRVYNVELLNAFALPTQYYYLGPLPCGPVICQPLTLPRRCHTGIDVSFSCVVKTQRRWSNKIYKTELTKTRYNNQVLGKYRVDPQRAGLTLIVELTWSNFGLKGVLNKIK